MSVVKELQAPSCPLCWSKHVPGGVFSTHTNPKDTSVLHACTGGKGLFPVAQTNVSAGRSSQGLNWCSEWVEEWVEEWVSPPPDQAFIHGSTLLD